MEGHMAFIAIAKIRAHVIRPLIGFRQQHAGVIMLVKLLTDLFEDGMGLGKIFIVGALAFA
jgi:hypothetical protein